MSNKLNIVFAHKVELPINDECVCHLQKIVREAYNVDSSLWSSTVVLATVSCEYYANLRLIVVWSLVSLLPT